MDSEDVTKNNLLKRNSNKISNENVDFQTANDKLLLNNVLTDQDKKVTPKQPESPTNPVPQDQPISLQSTSSEISSFPNIPSQDPDNAVNYFDMHMAQWESDLRKPLVVPSSNAESHFPSCYSKECFDKLYSQNHSTMWQHSFENQSQSSFTNWNVEIDQRGQEALEYFRKLSAQPRIQHFSLRLLNRKPQTD